MVKNEHYTATLEDIIKRMLIPLKGVPFNLVIESLTGRKVIPFDLENDEDTELLVALKRVAVLAGKEINKKGIKNRRANEVGNDIEEFVKGAMGKYNLNPDTPAGKIGKKKSMGYPDIIFFFKGKPYYLECKTYNLRNISTSQRSFYFSPSEDFKVIHDTHHFVLSYEMIVAGRSGEENIYKSKHYKILSLESLSLDVKYEFNSNNRRIYSGEYGTLLLNEGDIV